MATKKKSNPAKPKKAAAKKTAPKKKAVVKKAVAVVKKTTPKKKAATKKAAAKKIAPKKKVVAKKVAPKKKVALKKVVAKKTIAVKKPIAKKVVAVTKPKISPVAKTIAVPVVKQKVIEVTHPESAKSLPATAKGRELRKAGMTKPLSRNQQKKSSLKKRTSERDSLLEDTYTANPKIPKNTLPVDPKAFKLAKSIVNAIEEKKGDNIVCIDLRNIENRVCDYFIICEGTSSTQIDAIGGSVEFLVKKELGERPYRSEGYENKTWILIDYVNVIVHVFDKETRHFYNLESLWADGERIKF